MQKTSDTAAIAAILNHPKVYPFMTDDGSPGYYMPDVKQFHIMNEEKTGVVRLDPLNAICCMAHIAATPKLWGSAKEFVTSALSWGFKNTYYSKVVAIIPEFNRLTIKLCIDCYFEIEGKLHKSFLKNWKYYDQVVFGITKTDFYKNKQ